MPALALARAHLSPRQARGAMAFAHASRRCVAADAAGPPRRGAFCRCIAEYYKTTWILLEEPRFVVVPPTARCRLRRCRPPDFQQRIAVLVLLLFGESLGTLVWLCSQDTALVVALAQVPLVETLFALQRVSARFMR